MFVMLHRFIRCSLAAAAALAVLAAGAPAFAQTLQTVTIVVQPVDVTGNVYYAIDLGIFKKYGLDVQVVPIANPALIVQAVSGGTVDFGSTSLMSIARAHLGGIAVVLVAPSGANSSKSPLEGIIVANRIPALTALVRRSALLEHAPDLHREELLYQDWHLWIRLVAKCRFAFAPEVVARSRIHSYNASWNIDAGRNHMEIVALLELVRDEADAIGGRLADPHTRFVLHMEIARHHHALVALPRARAALQEAADVAGPHLAVWVRPYFIGTESSQSEAGDFATWLLHSLEAHFPPSLEKQRRALGYTHAGFRAARSGQRLRALAFGARVVTLDSSWLRDPVAHRLGALALLGPTLYDRVRGRLR